jgi:hypothetical protein
MHKFQKSDQLLRNREAAREGQPVARGERANAATGWLNAGAFFIKLVRQSRTTYKRMPPGRRL